jgi:hypothetical protein
MGAASFKSLYQKRPAGSMPLRKVAWRGAPDTALRHLVTNLLSVIDLEIGRSPTS